MTAVVVMVLGIAAQDPSAGEKSFLANKCNRCHAVSSHDIEATAKSESMHGPDLGSSDNKHDTEWMKSYIHRRVELEGKKHRSRWAGTPEDLEVIVEWLLEIRSD